MATSGQIWPVGGNAFSPIEGTVLTSPFGAPRAGRPGGHAGADFLGRVGTEVRAIRRGIVVFVLSNADNTPRSGWYGYGGVVGIYHPDAGKYTLSAHLDSVSAAESIGVGNRAEAGQVIGTVGETSGTPPKFPDMTPHLHLEVKDPYPGGGDRLIPRSRGGTAPFPRRYGVGTMDPRAWLRSFGLDFVGRRPVRIIEGSPADPERASRAPERAPERAEPAGESPRFRSLVARRVSSEDFSSLRDATEENASAVIEAAASHVRVLNALLAMGATVEPVLIATIRDEAPSALANRPLPESHSLVERNRRALLQTSRMEAERQESRLAATFRRRVEEETTINLGPVVALGILGILGLILASNST